MVPHMADEELWHVRLSPDEVKVLTLDQLDDLFRLEVIEADALVWQPGMDEWLPLSVVAGLGDDDGPSVSIPVSEPPPAPTQRRVGATTAVGWPPAPGTPLSQRPAPPPLSQRPVPGAPSQRPAPAPLSQRPAPAPLSQRPAPAALSQRPAPAALSQRPAPAPLSQRPVPGPLSSRPAPPPLSQRPVPPAPHGSSYPAQAWVDPNPVASVSPFAATAQAAQLPLYAESSTAPSVADIRMAPRSRSGGTFVIVLALAAGAAVTLYRNAVVHAAAQSMGQEKSYLELETALGGPAFGTPRAVDRMTDATRSLVNSVSAAAAAPPAAPSLPSPVKESEPSEAPAAAAKPAPTSAPVAAAPSPRPQAPAAVVRTSSRSEPDPLMTSPKKGKKAGKASEYDPLNGNL